MNNKEFLEKLKVINDNTRLTILELLSKKGTMCACNILEELNITQGTLSHHMKVLTDSGIVTFTKEGKWCHYSLVNESICEVSEFLRNICSNESNKKCCCKDGE